MMIDYLFYLLIGTYTAGTSEGLYVYTFNEQTGESEYVSTEKVENASYVTTNEDNTFVYAVTENAEEPAFANTLSFDKQTGKLKLLNTQETKGGAPCNIVVDSRGTFAVTANYSGGNLSVFPIQADGTLAALSQLVTFEGKGIIAERQDKPHLHCVNFSPDGKYLFAADLGTDHIYRFDTDYSGKGAFLNEESLVSCQTAAGSGPRHFIFHPSGKYMYLVTELGGTVVGFIYADGDLKEFQTIEADPLHAMGSADIRITLDGKFLYASNRLKGDGLAIYAIDQTTGRLTPNGYQYTGKHPRNFAVSPNGKFLLVADKDSDQVQVFEIDGTTGLLTDIHKDIQLNMPVCLTFIE